MDYKPKHVYSARVNPDHCAEGLITNDRAAHYYQCPRNPKPGTRYCWQHGPEGKAALKEKREARWKAAQDEREARRAMADERDRKDAIRSATNEELVAEIQRRGGWLKVSGWLQ